MTIFFYLNKVNLHMFRVNKTGFEIKKYFINYYEKLWNLMILTQS